MFHRRKLKKSTIQEEGKKKGSVLKDPTQVDASRQEIENTER